MQLIPEGGRGSVHAGGAGVYRPDVDGLRAIAVGSVIIFHAFPSVLRGGFVGVDVFFVISGFLISGLIFEGLEAASFSFSDFYARRVRRIFPALLLVLLSSLVCGWFLLLAGEYKALGKHVAAGGAFVSNLVLWSEAGYFDATAQSKPLLHLWSLGIEEQFYLCWPLMCWLAYRKRKSFVALTALVAVGSFAINILTISHDQVAAFYSPLARFWELMVGGFLAYLSRHKPDTISKYPNLQSWIGISCVCAALFLVTEDSKFPGWWALLPSSGTFLLLSASPVAWLNRRVLGNRALVLLGLISYPLYLWHWPVLFFTSLVSVPSRRPRIIAVVISLLLAAITYLLVEKPLRRAKGLIHTAVMLAAGMSIVTAMGLVCYFGGGLAFRLSSQFSAYAEPSQVTPDDCLLTGSADVPRKCLKLEKRPAVFIWGDSHANSFAAGLGGLVAKGMISKLQVTGSSCPPLLDFTARGNNQCKEINQEALHAIVELKPDLVILHSLWAADAYDLGDLPATLRRLEQAGVKRIIVLGPVPRWDGSLLRSMFRCWKPRTASQQLPQYSQCGLDPSVAGTDNVLRELVRGSGGPGTKYVSAYDLLCNEGGCLTHLADSSGKDQLETYDYGHISVAAAEYLTRSIIDTIVPNPATPP